MTDEGAVLAFSFLKRPSGFETLARKELTYWRGIALEDVFIGDCTIPFQAKDCMFELSPYSFMQNHLNLTPFLYEKIVALVEGKRVLDLYAGSGIVSTLLAKQQKDVLCIESAFEAMIAAKKNQQLNHVSFDMLHERVEHRLIDHLDSYQPDTVIVNPPRVGIHESVAHALKEKGPSTVIYMSCMPTTFARDLKRMSHYTIHQLFLYDTFPQTTHVEMIAQLQRKPSI
jgi:23S rRNA (uracil1939-C5)-methyltransferase